MIPSEPDFMERYENPSGYDNTWEGAVVTGGSVYDPNKTRTSVVGAPADWGVECLEVSPAVGETSINNIYPYGVSNEQTVFYFKFDMIIGDASGLLDDTYIRIFRLVSQVSGTSVEGRIYYLGGNLRIQINCYHDGSSNIYNSIPILVEDTEYRVEVKWDTDDGKWAWRLDGVNQPNNIDSLDPITSDGTLIGSPNDVHEVFIGSLPTAITATYYIDNIGTDIDGWIGDRGTGVQFQKDDMILEWFLEPPEYLDQANKRAIATIANKFIEFTMRKKTVEPSTNSVVKTITTTVHKKTTTPTITDKTLDLEV